MVDPAVHIIFVKIFFETSKITEMNSVNLLLVVVGVANAVNGLRCVYTIHRCLQYTTAPRPCSLRRYSESFAHCRSFFMFPVHLVVLYQLTPTHMGSLTLCPSLASVLAKHQLVAKHQLQLLASVQLKQEKLPHTTSHQTNMFENDIVFAPFPLTALSFLRPS